LKGDDDSLISFDQTHFYQIITNILQNAIDATSNNNKIVIEFLKKEKLEISIRDFGAGIDSSDLSKIFEPYYTRKKKGTGLGLALVNKLIDVNNAAISVQSRIGEGSVFIIKMETA